MSKILVTGGNGFVAAQVLISTLNRGYQVVTTVRNQQKAEQTKQALARRLGSKIDNLSFHIVPSIEAPYAFDEVIQSNQFIAVLHTATPFHFTSKDPKEIVDPAIGSTKSILKSIKEFGLSVKRVIITSSTVAILDQTKGYRPGYVYTEKDWNPITWEETHNGPINAYFGAKTWAEKAAWEFMVTERPQFELITLCPPAVYGDTAQYVQSAAALNTTSAQTYAVLSGQEKEIRPQVIMSFVNVRDLGEAHALAIDAPNAGNHRIIIAADAPLSNKGMSDAFIKHYPETATIVPTKLPEGFDENGFPAGGYYLSDNSLSKELLGMTYQTLEETMVQFAESMKSLPALI